MRNEQKIEEDIMFETPYNWKKHMLFHLPDLFYSLVKITIIVAIANTIFISMSQSIAMYMYEEHQEDHLH